MRQTETAFLKNDKIRAFKAENIAVFNIVFKCGDFEYHISNTIYKILQLVGIEDDPSFKWNRIANMTEETQMVLLAANYLDDETILNHLSWITPEEVDGILKRRDAEDLNRLGMAQGASGDVPQQATKPEKVNEDE